MKAIYFLIIVGLFSSLAAKAEVTFAELAIQDQGRVKPLDSFARESMQLLYGKKRYNGRNSAKFFMACLTEKKVLCINIKAS